MFLVYKDFYFCWQNKNTFENNVEGWNNKFRTSSWIYFDWNKEAFNFGKGACLVKHYIRAEIKFRF